MQRKVTERAADDQLQDGVKKKKKKKLAHAVIIRGYEKEGVVQNIIM